MTRKINLTSRFPVHDFGAYHVRANVYFPDLNKFFYSTTKVFQVADARPIWQKTVGVPAGMPGAGEARTYSLLSSRLLDHSALYVRVENKETGAVYTTYSLGRIIASDDPQAEIDRMNQLHVLHCAAPRSWAYSRVGVNGELLGRSTFLETKTRPRLRHAPDGSIAVQWRKAGSSHCRVEARARAQIIGTPDGNRRRLAFSPSFLNESIPFYLPCSILRRGCPRRLRVRPVAHHRARRWPRRS